MPPEDETTREGQFQLRCRDLINEIKALGFTPGEWMAAINVRGAVGSTKHLLASRQILPATHWLLDHRHAELTLESEIQQDRWHDLFTDEERAEAAHRLTVAGRRRPKARVNRR